MKMSRGELVEKSFLLLCVGVLWPTLLGWQGTWIRIVQVIVLVVLAAMAIRKIIQWRRL